MSAFVRADGGARAMTIPEDWDTDRWNAERSLASIRLRYRHTPQALATIT